MGDTAENVATAIFGFQKSSEMEKPGQPPSRWETALQFLVRETEEKVCTSARVPLSDTVLVT